MKYTIGLQVNPETVDIEMRQGARSWTASRTIVAGDLRTTVRELLLDVPRSRWLPRPSIVAAIGSHASRVKRLRGLPSVSGARILDSVIRENAPRFFLWDVPFVTTGLHRLGDGEAMGGAIASTVIDDVMAGCVDAGYVLRAVHPMEDERLVIRPTQSGDASMPVTQFRAALAITICGVALLGILLTPGLAAKRMARHAEQELAKLSHMERRSADAVRELQRNTALMETMTQFEQHRRSATLLLAALTEALPPESAVTTVREDSVGVDLVIVSSRAAGVLGALDRVPGIVAPEIIGPIGREVAGPREVERATIHFKYDPSMAKPVRVPYMIERGKGE